MTGNRKTIRIVFTHTLVRLPWSIKAYMEATKTRNSVPDPSKFPPFRADGAAVWLLDEPCIVTDCEDRIVLWYLPEALSPARAVCTFHLQIKFPSDVFSLDCIFPSNHSKAKWSTRAIAKTRNKFRRLQQNETFLYPYEFTDRTR